MNWYNLFKLADKRNFLIQQGYKPEIAEWAAKLNNKYAVWLANMATQGVIKPGEDDEKLNNTLKKFHRAKQLKDFPYKDINQFRSYGDLVRAIEPFLGQESKREQHRAQETEGAKLLLDQPPYKVYRLDTPEAAAKLCRDTEWCVKDPRYYAQYIKLGPLYLVEKNGERYALVHYESNQFMNAYDNYLRSTEKLELVELLKPVTGRDQTNVSGLAYEHARDVIGGRFPEGEPAIATNPAIAYNYAKDIVKSRFPEGETVIAKNYQASYNYALNILKGRFPEGEAAIGSNPEHSRLYALNVIKGRFPQGEAAIAKNPGLIYEYAKDIIGGRFPEGEAKIATDPGYAYHYARNIVKGRFPEGEAAIATDPVSAYGYARDVIGGRFPEGEAEVAKDSDYAYRYARDAIGGRFPEGEAAIAKDYQASYFYAKTILRAPWPEAGVNEI